MFFCLVGDAVAVEVDADEQIDIARAGRERADVQHEIAGGAGSRHGKQIETGTHRAVVGIAIGWILWQGELNIRGNRGFSGGGLKIFQRQQAGKFQIDEATLGIGRDVQLLGQDAGTGIQSQWQPADRHGGVGSAILIQRP